MSTTTATKIDREYGDITLDKDAQIEIEDRIVLPKVSNAYIIRNDDLAHRITEKYKNVFHDMLGCNIVLNANCTFDILFYFTPNKDPKPEGKISSVINIADATKATANNYYTQRQAMYNKEHGNLFSLNDDTKLLLSHLMLGGKDKFKPRSRNWDRNIKVTMQPVAPTPGYMPSMYNPNALIPVIEVSGFNFYEILNACLENQFVTKTEQKPDGTQENTVTNGCWDAALNNRIPPIEPGTFFITLTQFSPEEISAFIAKNTKQVRTFPGIIVY